ncbi:hypothetical protein MMC17_004367 [Xylographa soralifera]|nr:hypothetical protein [Xylographa soralifera]
MHKTLLLCFIHGFKGGDDTFGGFPEHLRALVSHALPQVSVSAIVYPQFETRGDLKECVVRFREWWDLSVHHHKLQNKVIDLEVKAGTPSPTVDPSVRTVLIGHSMGGIVAADTLLSITAESPISSTSNSKQGSRQSSRSASPHSFMFPYIQGVLAFDTPYLGISPGVVAYGAESHYKTATTAYSAIADAASVFGFGGAAAAATNKQQPGPARQAVKPGPEAAKEVLAASMAADNASSAAVPAWQRWGKYAMYAGAAGAVAAGGAAAYLKRDTITEGWTWVGSHLEFVGCLVRGEELKSRLRQIAKLKKEKGIGFADLITVLGKGGERQGKTVAGGFIEVGGVHASDRRTFCVLPSTAELKPLFEGMVNDKATDETVAHMSMFAPREYPGYYRLSERAKKLIVDWIDPAWYESSEGKEPEDSGENYGEGEGLGAKTL